MKNGTQDTRVCCRTKEAWPVCLFVSLFVRALDGVWHLRYSIWSYAPFFALADSLRSTSADTDGMEPGRSGLLNSSTGRHCLSSSSLTITPKLSVSEKRLKLPALCPSGLRSSSTTTDANSRQLLFWRRDTVPPDTRRRRQRRRRRRPQRVATGDRHEWKLTRRKTELHSKSVTPDRLYRRRWYSAESRRAGKKSRRQPNAIT